MAHPSDGQPRSPKGHPDGGEWNAVPALTAAFDVRDLPDEEYNADGSFEYPPVPRSADQVLSFWLGASVPDVVLENLQVTYEKAEAARAESAGGPLFTRYMEDAAYRAEVGDQSALRALMEETSAGFAASHPVSLEDADIRMLARVASAHHQAQSLNEVERAKVLEHPVYVQAWGGHDTTIGKVERLLELNRFRDGGVFRDPTRWVGNQLTAMAHDLEESVERSRLPMTPQEYDEALGRHGLVEVPVGKKKRGR